METQEIQQIECSHCNGLISTNNKYCSICGKEQKKDQTLIDSRKWPGLKQIGLFFAIELTCCVAALSIDNFDISTAILFDIIMAGTAMLFFSYNWRENAHLLKWPNFSLKKTIICIIISITASNIVQFLDEHLNHSLFNKDYSYYTIYKSHKYGKYIMIISVALFPALFEELAYRGYLMQKLLTIVDKKEAIYITSILFFFMHLSMTSFFWMLPFSIVLAQIRIRENTLWYGIIIHFTFNLTVCMMEILTFDTLI